MTSFFFFLRWRDPSPFFFFLPFLLLPGVTGKGSVCMYVLCLITFHVDARWDEDLFSVLGLLLVSKCESTWNMLKKKK